jgi:signal transduction histidine kinase
VRLRRLRGRVLGLGRLVVAVALLATVWIVTVTQVGRANHDAENQRVKDRLPLARAFASAVSDQLTEDQNEAKSVAAAITSASAAQSALDRYAPGRDAMVVDRKLLILAASPGLSSLRNTVVSPCRQRQPDTQLVVDTGLQDLVASATSGPTTSHFFNSPIGCRPVVAAAAPAGPYAVVILRQTTDLQQAISLALRLGAGNRAFVIDPPHPAPDTSRLALTPTAAPAPAPPSLSSFVDAVGAGGAAARHLTAGSGGVPVVVATAPIGNGWTLVLEEDGAVFVSTLPNRPTIVVGALLTGAFGIVLIVLLLFDLRRQRAHQRAEVAKHAFFSIVSHELRTPLTVLKGFAETLADRWDALDDSQRHMMIDNLAPQVLRLSRVVDRLLLASSIQADTNARPIPRPTPVADHLQRVARRFRPVAPLHTFVLEVDAGLPDVLADPQALDQVLDQLVDNAVRYSPAGGTVTLEAKPAGRGVSISVEDQGVGLPSNYRRVFEAFVQGESVDRRVHDEGGVGVGLFIARSLLKQMGGRVDAERGRKTGARFVVSLPAAGIRRRLTSPSVARP